MFFYIKKASVNLADIRSLFNFIIKSLQYIKTI